MTACGSTGVCAIRLGELALAGYRTMVVGLALLCVGVRMWVRVGCVGVGVWVVHYVLCCTTVDRLATADKPTAGYMSPKESGLDRECPRSHLSRNPPPSHSSSTPPAALRTRGTPRPPSAASTAVHAHTLRPSRSGPPTDCICSLCCTRQVPDGGAFLNAQ